MDNFSHTPPPTPPRIQGWEQTDPALVSPLPASANLILDWFAGHGWTPFDFQHEAWAAYLAGESGLIHAPTGTGKTYAAWLGAVMEWIGEHPDRAAWAKLTAPPLQVLWITPLRALSADTERALRQPL